MEQAALFEGMGCQGLQEDGILDLSWLDRATFCSARKVNRSCSFDPVRLHQQQSCLWLASRKSLNYFVHLFLQRAKRKGNKYLLFYTPSADFIPFNIFSLLLWKLLWL